MIDGRAAEDEMQMVENDRVVTVLGKPKRGMCQELVAPTRREVYIKLHKPRGVVCSHVRQSETPIISDVYPIGAEDCHCVGRLDSRSEGLLLVTSDGFFTRSASMPETHVEKEYVVLVGGGTDKSFRPPTDMTLKQLGDGVDLLDGKPLAAALEAEVLQCDAVLGLARLRLVVDSGRYHLVRRMMAALGASLSFHWPAVGAAW